MTHRFLVLLLLLTLSQQLHAQTNPLDKKLQKAEELAQKNKLKESVEYLEKLLKENPRYGPGWDLLMKIKYAQYEEAKDLDGTFSNIQITTKDKDGKEIKDDSLVNKLADLLQDMKPSRSAYTEFFNTLRRATLYSDDAWESSSYIRRLKVDVNIDSNVSKKALKFYSDAEDLFGEKSYTKAAKLYQRAIEEQPDFYKASLYLGDCHYAVKNYTDAAVAFKAAKTKFPDQLEPRKYLADAYANLNLYDKAIDETIETFAVYPDVAMVHKLDYFTSLNHQRVAIRWVPRAVFPLQMKDRSEDESKDMKAKGPWVFYEAAYEKIKPYCNARGMIVKANTLTKAKYLEVFAWEEMLKNSKDPLLDEARRMQELGMLDCYVLVTCFHYDLYDQYRHFAAANNDRIVGYYKKALRSQ